MRVGRAAALVASAALPVALLAAGCASAPSGNRAVTPSSAAHRAVAATPSSPAPPPNTPSASPSACRTNAHGQLVEVSLAAQHLWMCHGTRVVHQSAITSGETGQYTETPTGHFRIQDLERDQTLTLVDGRQFRVKYWIPFDAPLFGFHDASWQKFPFGSPEYHHHGSHGCVHLPERTIATLYRWAHVGTRVDIMKR